MYRVLVVDGSPLVRHILQARLESDAELTVVGCVASPLAAFEIVAKRRPDVVVTGLDLPHISGLSFLGRLRHVFSGAVIVFSRHTPHGGAMALKALARGAVETVHKGDAETDPAAVLAELVEKVKLAALTVRSPLSALRDTDDAAPEEAPSAIDGLLRTASSPPEAVLVVGASTGGTEALSCLLAALPANTPGMVIVQHLPRMFTAAFAARLDSLGEIVVREARDGDAVRPGLALVCPGDRHIEIRRRSGGGYVVDLSLAPPVNRHRPSVDVLFRSAAAQAGIFAIGVLLTGMGRDGAEGLLEMRRAGAHTVAQDEATCIVYGMPREAVARGAACEILPLSRIPQHILLAVLHGTQGRRSEAAAREWAVPRHSAASLTR